MTSILNRRAVESVAVSLTWMGGPKLCTYHSLIIHQSKSRNFTVINIVCNSYISSFTNKSLLGIKLAPSLPLATFWGKLGTSLDRNLYLLTAKGYGTIRSECIGLGCEFSLLNI